MTVPRTVTGAPAAGSRPIGIQVHFAATAFGVRVLEHRFLPVAQVKAAMNRTQSRRGREILCASQNGRLRTVAGL
jgi:hypothetical protein